MRIISEMLHHYWKDLFDQFSFHDTEIPQWFAHKDWSYLLSDLNEAYDNLVKEFYANAIVEGEGRDTSHQPADA